MTQKKTAENGPALVIVESPAKAKTIGKYLGPDYIVEASVGHIRDLPKGAREIPEKYKKEPWARLGVNVDSNFEPIYVVPDEKTKQIKKLKDLLKNASTLYLATDEDREGEAISWHLLETLQPRVPARRLVFHEITKSAILEALQHPRDVDENLVGAQETRRVIDRLYGYEASPLLWYKIRNNLSAGRVQSVAVRLIVERERERMSFKNAVYWDVLGSFSLDEARAFQATLTSVGGKAIPSGKDFDPSTGLLSKPEKFALLDERSTSALIQRLLQAGQAFVESVEEKPYSTRPYPPFTTSALQQEANRKLGFTAKRTMSVAQSLYENGYITYMRTDSTNLSQEAISAARRLVQTHYGDAYLPEKPRYYQTKVKNAQEAHEAIRPAGSVFPLPEELRGKLSSDEFKLYDLVWKRTIASQMKDAVGKRKTIVVALDDAQFHVGGKMIDFPGYLRAYVEGKDDPNAELADQETILPDVKKGEALQCVSLKPQEHTTTPPQRYSEASLTKTLEDKGIGRPSTYASIIDVILNRHYVFKKGGALIPTWTAFAVCKLLETHFPVLVDYGFTADMENELDEISRGERNRFDYLRAFYFGSESNSKRGVEFPFPDSFAPGLKTLIQNKTGEIDAREVSRFFIGVPKNEDGSDGEPVYLRVGRFGPFLEQGETQASVNDETPPDELTLDAALKLLESSKQPEAPLGHCPETGKPIFLKHGRFGWYVQRGENDDKDKQNASLLRNMQNGDVNLEVAIALLSLPKTLGVDPDVNEPVIVSNGRFGPYVKRGAETRSLSSDLSPLEITLDQALELLAKPKYGSKTTAKKSEPLVVFDVSPVTGETVKLLSGRFGPYVTDGETNASLPKDLTQDELTFERALELLANRAAKGPSTRAKRSAKKTTKKAASKKTSSKKTAKKTAASKTTTKKKAAVKKKATSKAKIDDSSSEAPF
ncbi:MAG: type I DNA topoisomerase [Thermoguttaceae bacterium]|nr:type I DNA topoisomerase [Thermoguttaceae bacterium]